MGDSVPAGGGMIPEPATPALLALGACPALLRRRKRAAKRPGSRHGRGQGPIQD